MSTRTVIGIPASFDQNEDLETNSTKKYLSYLHKEKAHTVMTTAGTSTFNLLTVEEIHALNKTVVFGFSGNKIIGVPALPTREAIKFVKNANDYLDDKSNLMLLYPDRFYNEEDIIDYMATLRSYTTNKVYVHGKTIRNATGGTWDYNESVINKLFDRGVLYGIKEEHSSLNKSYDFVSKLNSQIDVIVAGGSMRRYEFLNSAGANSFLSGVGNLFPKVEQSYINGDKLGALNKEKKLFDVFMRIGWHKSLRIALKNLDLTCYNNRSPWSKATLEEKNQITKVVGEINE